MFVLGKIMLSSPPLPNNRSDLYVFARRYILNRVSFEMKKRATRFVVKNIMFFIIIVGRSTGKVCIVSCAMHASWPMRLNCGTSSKPVLDPLWRGKGKKLNHWADRWPWSWIKKSIHLEFRVRIAGVPPSLLI